MPLRSATTSPVRAAVAKTAMAKPHVNPLDRTDVRLTITHGTDNRAARWRGFHDATSRGPQAVAAVACPSLATVADVPTGATWGPYSCAGLPSEAAGTGIPGCG